MSSRIQYHQLSNFESLAEEETAKGNRVVVTPASTLVETGKTVENIRTYDISYIQDSEFTITSRAPILYAFSFVFFLMGLVTLTETVAAGAVMVVLSVLLVLEGYRRQQNAVSPDNYRKIRFSTGDDSVQIVVEEEKVGGLVKAIREVNPKVELVD